MAGQPTFGFMEKLEELVESVSEGKENQDNIWDLLTCRSLTQNRQIRYPFDKNRMATLGEKKLIMRAIATLQKKIDLTTLPTLQHESGNATPEYKKQIGYYYLVQKEIDRARGIPINDVILQQDILPTGLTGPMNTRQTNIRRLLLSAPELYKVPVPLTLNEKQQANNFIATYMGGDDGKFGEAKNLKDFSNFEAIIKADLPSKKAISDVKATTNTLHAVFFNNDGYLYPAQMDQMATTPHPNIATGQNPTTPIAGHFSNLVKTNAPLRSPRNDPIGYTIAMPMDNTWHIKSTVKGLIVHIYGGGNPKSSVLGHATFPPGTISPGDQELIAQGYAIAHINLPDLFEIENKYINGTHQQHTMSQLLFNRVQECILTFFNTLKTNPEALHPRLAILKNVKKYLTGTSFGGGMAVRFAQEHPGTFDGYISVNGTLVERIKANTWLNPSRNEYLQKIAQPILLIQNYDDTRVLASTNAFSFIDAAKAAGKENLIRVYIPREGLANQGNLHGHYVSEKEEVLNGMVQAITQFLDDPNNTLLSPSRRKWVRHGLYAKRQYGERGAEKFLNDVSVYDYFLSEGLLAYKKLPALAKKQIQTSNSLDASWAVHFQPIFERSYIIAMFPSYNMREFFFQRIFDTIYPPHTTAAMRQEKARKAARIFLPTFIDYLKKKHPLAADLTRLNVDKLSRSEDIQNWFLANREFFLPEFLKANPEVVTNVYTSRRLQGINRHTIGNPDFGKFKMYTQNLERIETFSLYYPKDPGVVSEAKRLLLADIIRYEGLAKK